MRKKFSGPVQVLGLLGCLLAPAMFLSAVFPRADEKELLVGYLPFLLMPALACRILFEGDDSRLGRFFYGIGDGLFRWLYRSGISTLFGRLMFWARISDRVKGRGREKQDQLKRIEDEVWKKPIL